MTINVKNKLHLFYQKLHSLKNESNQILYLSRKSLFMWGVIIILEAVFFSCMKNIKTAEISSLINRQLAKFLRVFYTSFDANIENIMAGRQSQKSH